MERCRNTTSPRSHVVLTLLLIVSPSIATFTLTTGSVGCLFQSELCQLGKEWCFDDSLFGRCLPLQSDISDNVLTPLNEKLGDLELAALEAALQQLQKNNYQWNHIVSQCVLQKIINDFQDRESSIPAVCLELSDDSEDEAVTYDHEVESLRHQIFDRDDDKLYDQEELYNSQGNTFAEERPKLQKRFYQFFASTDEPTSNYDEDELLYDGLIKSTDRDDEINSPSSDLFVDPKFERQERLDVKKPGPLFNVNNFAFENRGENEDTLQEMQKSADEIEEIAAAEKKEKKLNPFIKYHSNSPVYQDEDYYSDTLKDYEEWMLQNSHPTSNTNDDEGTADFTPTDETNIASTQNGVVINQKFATASPDREIVETNYVFITINGEFQNWKQGAGLVSVLSEILRLPRDSFNDIGVQGNQLTFQVLPRMEGLNPSFVAAKADEMRKEIQQKTGLEIVTTGIGDQSGVSSILYWGQENQQMLLTIGLCFLVTATLVTAIVIFLLRKRQISRQKMKDLTQSVDTEATRDYQDLCRTRMAIKSSTSDAIKDAAKLPHSHLSRDSESSRSSTSSWCEEPVLTNMDISTGHMVLSYMEDHLRNKFRLEQEWLSLCSYEAEPSTSISTATKEENGVKNRYSDALPYDHSRVILNALANVNGSDYINASLITDHDPRHSAYIAAQSPVAETVADFWQMIWEQGSAVLVLLTRTTENGVNMCHKYWPEEGSQLYHIYEVHLVSEHIWCDDYLVRSFYLKNVRTSETRTVTQFHFQSWPENGIPSSTKALLEFRRKVNKSYRGRSCPIVVHCSDGAGRTGTYCLIDMVLHRMSKGSREIDIAATLEHLRDQRAHAVRNKQQFEFVLTAVAEEVHAILRALPQ